MAKPRMDLSAFIGKLLESRTATFLREGIRVPSQALMETEVPALIGADRHERTGTAMVSCSTLCTNLCGAFGPSSPEVQVNLALTA